MKRKPTAQRLTAENAPLMCPVCDHLGGESDWLIHDKFGFRYCPQCKGSGYGASPLYTIPIQNPKFKGSRATD